MEDSLPRPSGRYLNIILGSINVSILDKKAKYDYKDQYERFKLIVNLVGKRKVLLLKWLCHWKKVGIVCTK